ncbi:MAG: FMN-binding protein [Fusobacteriaceae bacterium]
MSKIDNIRKYSVIIFIAAGLLAAGVESFKTLPKYTGTGDGFYDDIVVEISAERNRKGEIRVKEIAVTHKDTEAIANPAIENLKQQLLEKQDPDKLDMVAGATFTSEGVVMAIEDAFGKVK